MNKIAISAVLIIGLSGCGVLGPRDATRTYVLDVPSKATSTTKAARTATLLVAPTTVSSFYDTTDIAYSRAPGERAYYQYHAWAERPGRRMTDLLVRRLELAGTFQTVVTTVSGIRGEVVLNTHLNEFYHDAAASPGSVRISVTAELVDPARRVLLGRRTFDRVVSAASYDASGAVQAFGSAVGALLDELTIWVDVSTPR